VTILFKSCAACFCLSVVSLRRCSGPVVLLFFNPNELTLERASAIPHTPPQRPLRDSQILTALRGFRYQRRRELPLYFRQIRSSTPIYLGVLSYDRAIQSLRDVNCQVENQFTSQFILAQPVYSGAMHKLDNVPRAAGYSVAPVAGYKYVSAGALLRIPAVLHLRPAFRRTPRSFTQAPAAIFLRGMEETIYCFYKIRNYSTQTIK
jgi:hypothetical protein